jgi:hypothetical protein
MRRSGWTTGGGAGKRTARTVIGSPAGSFEKAEGGDIGVQFVTGSAAVRTPEAVLEDYRLRAMYRAHAKVRSSRHYFGHLLLKDWTETTEIDTRRRAQMMRWSFTQLN